jgi:hypothetical protein
MLVATSRGTSRNSERIWRIYDFEGEELQLDEVGRLTPDGRFLLEQRDLTIPPIQRVPADILVKEGP